MIPRGIEVLTRKANVDPEFRRLLLQKRAAAAEEIGLRLTESEKLLLGAVPEAQLQAFINSTQVPSVHRAAFLGKVAAVMLAAMGVVQSASGIEAGVSKGVRPDAPPPSSQPSTQPTAPMPAPTGIRPDDPVKVSFAQAEGADRVLPRRGIRPDRPPVTQPASQPEAGAEAVNPGLAPFDESRPYTGPALLPDGIDIAGARAATSPSEPVSRGVRPDRPAAPDIAPATHVDVSDGMRPDRPVTRPASQPAEVAENAEQFSEPPLPQGPRRPMNIEIVDGIRPDRPRFGDQ